MEMPLRFGENRDAETTFLTVTFRDGSRRELEVTVEDAAKLWDSGTIPSQRSDLSGAKISDGERETIIASFSNGTKRKLVAKAEEAEELARRGRAASRQFSSISWYYRVPKSLRLAVATVFVGALLTPAISRQFTDRQQESELKSKIAEQIYTSSARAMQAFHVPVFHLLPEQLAADEYCQFYKLPKTVANREQCDNSKSRGERAAATRMTNGQIRWTEDSSITWNNLGVFSDSELRNNWTLYYGAVHEFSRVSPGSCGPEYDQLIKDLHNYLNKISPGQYDQAMKDLNADTKPCSGRDGRGVGLFVQGDSKFLQAYESVERRLVYHADEMAYAIERAHSSRYSVGFKDFVRDLFTPFGSD
jgi:hypothetical protein